MQQLYIFSLFSLFEKNSPIFGIVAQTVAKIPKLNQIESPKQLYSNAFFVRLNSTNLVLKQLI
jgi:hypothetical protein